MISAMSVSSVATLLLRPAFVVDQQNLLILVRLFSSFTLLLLLAGCDTSPRTGAPPPLEFAGSDACRECHTPQFELWQSSHHALAMQVATPDTVLGDFSNAELSYFDLTSTFFERDGEFVVRTDNASGELEDFTVAYTFGVAPLQQYLVELANGHVQALPFAWDARSMAEGGQRWYHLYPDEFIAHDDPLHWTGRQQNWNYMCAECHSTKLEKNYDLDSDSFATTFSEINVGCEGCHGPGSRHITLARDGAGSRGLAVDLDDSGAAVWQMNPDTGIAERSELPMRPPRQPDACGRCHSRRSLATAGYEFGKPLHDTHVPALLEESLYFPDGQILDEVYVYGSFVQSRMYRAGVTCSDCHEPHSARLGTSGAASEICGTCHLPGTSAAVAHHKHETADVECVDCHMPSRTYMGVDERRDHSFRIPRPDLTESSGSPNACNQCHTDRDSDWAARAIDAWYGGERVPHFAAAIDSGRRGSPEANELLLAAIGNDDYPGIARATALTLLRAPYSAAIAAAISRNLSNPDSLIRAAALTVLSRAAPELIVERATPLLADPVRSVRIEAARTLSPVQSLLPDRHSAAFRRANAERIAAQRAVAERPEAHLNLGNIYLDARNPDMAEAEFRLALRFEPRAVPARVNLADLYSRTGRIAEAEKLLRDGIAMNAGAAALYHALGLMLVRDGRRDAALAELESAAGLEPGEPRFVYVHAVALNSLGRADEAVTVLADAAERFPADFDIHYALATFLRDQGSLDKAREVAASLSETYPHVSSVQGLLQSLR